MNVSNEPFTEMTINVPLILLNYIYEHNNTQHGPDGTKINITQTCIDAMRSKLNKVR